MDVMRHDEYREICAAASIGQATPEELFKLEEHVAQCETCRRTYFDYLGLAARQYAVTNQNPALCSDEAKESLNSELFIRRFFARAEKEGIRFSADVDQEIKTAIANSAFPIAANSVGLAGQGCCRCGSIRVRLVGRLFLWKTFVRSHERRLTAAEPQ